MVTRTLRELAGLLGGETVGDPDTVIRGVAGIREAQPGDITFLANARYEPYLTETQASAVRGLPSCQTILGLRVQVVSIVPSGLTFQLLELSWGSASASWGW